MKDFSYNVLWIDDQWDDKEKGNYPFILNAKTKGIDIEAYKTSKEGMKAFEASLYKWDGIILDAKCFNESEYEVPDTDGMYNSIDKINQLSLKRFVPMYIYTGQADLLSEKNFRKSLRGKTPYVKGTDNDKLLADIIKAAENLEETRVRREYWDIFEAYPQYQTTLIRILTPIQKNDITDNEVLNIMRTFFEDKDCPFYSEFHKIGISKDLNSLADLSWHFQTWDIKIVPPHIKTSFSNLSVKGNLGSHARKAVEDGKLPYLIRSAVFDFLNILHWLKELPKDEISIKIYKHISERKREEQQEWDNIKNQNLELRITKDDDEKYYCTIKNQDMIKPEDNGKFFTINRSKLTKKNEK